MGGLCQLARQGCCTPRWMRDARRDRKSLQGNANLLRCGDSQKRRACEQEQQRTEAAQQHHRGRRKKRERAGATVASTGSSLMK